MKPGGMSGPTIYFGALASIRQVSRKSRYESNH